MSTLAPCPNCQAGYLDSPGKWQHCDNCGAVWTWLPFKSVDDAPHTFRYSDHCVDCAIGDPLRWARRELKGWNGRW